MAGETNAAIERYYFATQRGERGYSQYRRDFSMLIWRLASPTAVRRANVRPRRTRLGKAEKDAGAR